MNILRNSPRNVRRIAAAAVLTTVAAAGVAVADSGVAQASPIGFVGCNSVPVGSQLRVTCTNTDAGAGTMNFSVLCTNLSFEWYHTERIAAHRTETMVHECGPGGHPILWGASGITDYQQMLNDQQEEQEEQEQQAQNN